jgi:GT2 family glycosyltransferase
METSRYPYLAYLDDDCSVKPDWLASLMKGYRLREDVFAVFGQITNDWGKQVKPTWVIPATETWLGNNSFLGDQPRILESGFGIREGNLSIQKTWLQKFGGFLGMEQFGSLNMAAAELKYCLWQANRSGVKIAYMPAAVAYHHVVARSRLWMVKRAYWQGISDGIFDYLIFKRHFLSSVIHACYDLAVMAGLFLLSLGFLIILDRPKWLYHLLRTVRRAGLILSELRIRGNWAYIYEWTRNHSLG